MLNKSLFFLFTCLLFSCDTPEERLPSEQQNIPDKPKPLFVTKSPEETGIYFINELPEDRYRNILLYQYYYNGGGVAIGDINNDDLPDLYFSGNLSSDKLYLNLGGWRFEDITFKAGILPKDGKSWGTGVNMVDINGDGWLDIYVCRSGNFEPQNRKNLLYINNRNNTFTENAGYYGLDDPGYSVQSVFFDYDHDDDLDMFLLNHGMEYYGRTATQNNDERDPYVGDKLFRREADNSYTDVSDQAGILGYSRGYGLGVGVADLNQDGWDDIYVANDFYEHDYLYLNTGKGNFVESVKESTRQISFFGMGVELADFNNDALTDIVVLDMAAEDHVRQKSNLAGISRDKFADLLNKGYHYQYMYNSLQLNRGLTPEGKPWFSNIARLAGVDKTDWSWAPLLADFDNDGWKDLFISNGLRKDVLNHDFIQNMNTSLERAGSNFVELPEPEVRNILGQMPSEAVHNYIFKNQGGLRFTNLSQSWGVGEAGFSNGAAYADLDRDGDLDLVINNLDGPAGLYENRAQQQWGGHYVRLKLSGSSGNPMALGSKVWLYQKGTQQYQQMYPVRGYQSSVEPVLHFGLGETAEVDSLHIRWPDGKVSKYPAFIADRTVSASYQNAKDIKLTSGQVDTWLVESHNLESFRHREDDFDDFDQQFLLPHKLSRQGPALAVADINNDGLDDVYLGGARGYAGQLLIQQNNGSFAQQNGPWQQDENAEDTDALFFDADLDGDQDLLVISGGIMGGEAKENLKDRLYINQGQGSFVIQNHFPEVQVNSQCLAHADMDGDGDLDIFVGAGSEAGNYPVTETSYLLENQGGYFRYMDLSHLAGLQSIISRDADWQDLDRDGLPELIVVGEWSSPQAFRWSGSELQAVKEIEIRDQEGREISLSGLWQSVSILDVDNDGDQDILLGNFGLNYRYSANPSEPLTLFALDMDQNASLELWLAYYQNGRLLPARERDDIFEQWRNVKRLFPRYEDYAKADMRDILKEQYDNSLRLEADTLASMLLINEGDLNFEARALPDLGQISALQSALMLDINGDQINELVTAGNFFSTENQTPRLDASLGQVYQWQNDELQALGPSVSGLFARGDARVIKTLQSAEGLAIIIAHNGGPLQLFETNQAFTQNLIP